MINDSVLFYLKYAYCDLLLGIALARG